MAARKTYSCDFCDDDAHDVTGIHWNVDVAGNEKADARHPSQCSRHICQRCFKGIREIEERYVSWYSSDGGTA